MLEGYDLPKNPDTNVVYKLLPKDPENAYYKERTDRNIGWITCKEQEILRNKTIGIAGCGGMGGLLAQIFLRLGIGEIRIADCEVFDISNINRQFGATKSTVGKSKAFETARMLRTITDDTTLVVYPQGINKDNVDSFLDGCDVVCDEIEFWAIGARLLLHERSRAHGISIICADTVGFTTHVFFFTPESLTVEELLGFTLKEAIEIENKLRQGQRDKDVIERIMKSVLEGFAPALPEYCPWAKEGNREALWRRLRKEGKASIIATNPPLATGFLANRALLYLLEDSETKRDITDIPSMPGYVSFDAATLEVKVVRERWW